MAPFGPIGTGFVRGSFHFAHTYPSTARGLSADDCARILALVAWERNGTDGRLRNRIIRMVRFGTCLHRRAQQAAPLRAQGDGGLVYLVKIGVVLRPVGGASPAPTSAKSKAPWIHPETNLFASDVGLEKRRLAAGVTGDFRRARGGRTRWYSAAEHRNSCPSQANRFRSWNTGRSICARWWSGSRIRGD